MAMINYPPAMSRAISSGSPTAGVYGSPVSSFYPQTPNMGARPYYHQQQQQPSNGYQGYTGYNSPPHQQFSFAGPHRATNGFTSPPMTPPTPQTPNYAQYLPAAAGYDSYLANASNTSSQSLSSYYQQAGAASYALPQYTGVHAPVGGKTHAEGTHHRERREEALRTLEQKTKPKMGKRKKSFLNYTEIDKQTGSRAGSRAGTRDNSPEPKCPPTQDSVENTLPHFTLFTISSPIASSASETSVPVGESLNSRCPTTHASEPAVGFERVSSNPSPTPSQHQHRRRVSQAWRDQSYDLEKELALIFQRSPDTIFLLKKILENLISSPAGEEGMKYRRLSTANEKVHTLIIDVHGAMDAMQAIGFELENEGQLDECLSFPPDHYFIVPRMVLARLPDPEEVL